MTHSAYPDDMPLPVVPEYVFKARYLDLLMNMSTEEQFNRWMEVSGNPLVRVNVVDDNDNTKVLFWVPPLQYSHATTIGGNISADVKFAEDLRNHYESAGEKYLEQTMLGLVNPAEPPEEDVHQWDFIRGRYGLGPSVGEATRPAGTSTMAVSDDW